MTVKEFLEKQRASNPQAALGFVLDLLTILDEFDGEACSVFAGKIRAQLEAKPKTDVTDLQLAELCSFADKLDTTVYSMLYAIQFTAYLEELSKETGLSVQEIKNRAREYRANR